ncbi:unnamed protein product, partial [Symbiodinium pilosum]
LGIGWNPVAVVSEGILVNPGQRDYRLQNVPAVLIGGKYLGTKTWPSAGTWTITYRAPVTLYIWVMKNHYNAGVDSALSSDGWEQVPSPGFKRSDNHELNVWKRSFATGTSYNVRTNNLMVGGVVSKGCEVAEAPEKEASGQKAMDMILEAAKAEGWLNAGGNISGDGDVVGFTSEGLQRWNNSLPPAGVVCEQRQIMAALPKKAPEPEKVKEPEKVWFKGRGGQTCTN